MSLTPIIGKPIATVSQMQNYIKKNNENVADSVINMIHYYIEEGNIEGIRGDIAFAQSCLETGNFTFKDSAVTLDQNNFAGIGVTQNGMKGNSWDTPQLGIRAQIQHLKAYANKEELKQECVDPRFKYVERGCAEYVELLGIQENPNHKGWAAGAGYGEKILNILGKIINTDSNESEDDYMSNSSLVNVTIYSPNHSGKRTQSISRISPHCVVGQLSAESIGGCFDDSSVQASCNYGIGYDGRVVLCVDEANRSWCTSSNDNDQKAVTIECASDLTHPYTMTTAVYEKLIALMTDICKRNGKSKITWIPDKNKSLSYTPASNEMLITVHRWFANKACPGDWLYSRLGDIANRVNANLGNGGSSGGNGGASNLYRIRKSWADEKSQVGAYSSLENAKNACPKGYTVYDWNGKAVYTNGGSESGQMYRIRKSWADEKSQVGAFTSLENAKNACPKGYTVYDKDGNAVYVNGDSDNGSNNGGNNTSYKTGTYKVTADVLNVRKGPGTNYGVSTQVKKNEVYTITGVENGVWGKLKSGAGYVSLEYMQYTGGSSSSGNPSTPKVPYTVRITADVLNVRKGPGTNYGVSTQVRKNEVYTIVEETNGWGKLKSGAGYISLSYAVKC